MLPTSADAEVWQSAQVVDLPAVHCSSLILTAPATPPHCDAHPLSGIPAYGADAPQVVVAFGTVGVDEALLIVMCLPRTEPRLVTDSAATMTVSS